MMPFTLELAIALPILSNSDFLTGRLCQRSHIPQKEQSHSNTQQGRFPYGKPTFRTLSVTPKYLILKPPVGKRCIEISVFELLSSIEKMSRLLRQNSTERI
ncbi:MAG: hypothetical protein F6K16_38890 [Symploca sp. SIO2B6]|nr:hypothetical protein [Symploca sp. SIO2B6]